MIVLTLKERKKIILIFIALKNNLLKQIGQNINNNILFSEEWPSI
jgi:hypothetical protein